MTATVSKTTVAGTTVTGFGTAIAAGDIKINGVDIGALEAAGTAGERGSQTAAAVNAKSSQTGVTATGQTAGYTKATATAGAGVSSLDLSTASGAQSALTTIDAALSSVNSSRASLGAYQNRFASVVSSLQTTSENLSASRSRIQDADFAKETAAMTRGQILQQAGTAMLAQANSLPNGVLSLLRG